MPQPDLNRRQVLTGAAAAASAVVAGQLLTAGPARAELTPVPPPAPEPGQPPVLHPYNACRPGKTLLTGTLRPL